MRELKNFAILLGYLYRDELRFVEEISTIERLYLYPDVEAYIDDFKHPARFFLTRKTLSGFTSVYLDAGGDEKFVRSAVKRMKEHPKIHLQTGEFERSLIAEEFRFKSEYDYVIMSFDRSRFQPVYEPPPTRLTADLGEADLTELSNGNPDRYREEIRNGVMYGYKIQDSWVALAGTCARSNHYDYVFVETDTVYRGKGFARAMLSHVIRDLLEMGREPVYALDAANVPSIRLGEKMGFVPYKTLKCVYIGEWTSSRGAFDSDNIPESSFLV